MTNRIPTIVAAVAAALFVVAVGSVSAQVTDHLKCYKVRDALSFRGRARRRHAAVRGRSGLRGVEGETVLRAGEQGGSLVNKKTRPITPLPFSVHRGG